MRIALVAPLAETLPPKLYGCVLASGGACPACAPFANVATSSSWSAAAISTSRSSPPSISFLASLRRRASRFKDLLVRIISIDPVDIDARRHDVGDAAVNHALCPLVQVAWAFWIFLCHDLLCIGWRTNSRANW